MRSLTRAAVFTRAAALAGGALIATAGASCTSPAAQNCPNDLPAACPSPAPMFSADVSPLIQKYCAGCHSADGEEPNPLLVSYASITGSMDSTARMVETQLVQCNMPPAGQPQPTSEERQTILGWIICGARND